jgi:hypothetical protein
VAIAHDSSGLMPALKIAMGPMNDPALRIPFILTAEFNVISNREHG